MYSASVACLLAFAVYDACAASCDSSRIFGPACCCSCGASAMLFGDVLIVVASGCWLCSKPLLSASAASCGS